MAKKHKRTTLTKAPTELGKPFSEVGFAEFNVEENNENQIEQTAPPLMLTDGTSTRYGNLVTIEKTTKQRPKRLKVNPEGMRHCIVFLMGLIFAFLPILIRPLFDEMAEVSTNKFEEIQTPNVMSGLGSIASSFSMVLTFIGVALLMMEVFKFATSLVRGEPYEIIPFEWEYKTVEKETVKDFYCKSPKELEESDKNREKDPNKTTSMGVIYK